MALLQYLTLVCVFVSATMADEPRPSPQYPRRPSPPQYRPQPPQYKPQPPQYKPQPPQYKPQPPQYKPQPPQYKPQPPQYKPQPPTYKPQPTYDEPAVYQYDYTVQDGYSGVDFNANENRDGSNTAGSYRVALPDGRIQTVTYSVDGESGFVAEVTYEGEAQFPKYEPKKPTYPSPQKPAYPPTTPRYQ